MSKFGVHRTLNIVMCKDADDAIAQGYLYRDGFSAIEIEKVVVVQNGTVGGNSTVDLILVDETGKRYVTMLTGALLKSIPC